MSNSQPKTSATGNPSAAVQTSARIAASGIAEAGEQHVGDLQHRPGPEHVQRRGAEYLAAPGLAIELDDGRHGRSWVRGVASDRHYTDSGVKAAAAWCDVPPLSVAGGSRAGWVESLQRLV